MVQSSEFDRAYSIEVNKVVDLYNTDKLHECIERARSLLADNAMPRYHRIKTLVILGSTIPDWYEACACCEEADVIWRVVRRWTPPGTDPNPQVDLNMDELRRLIDELKETLDEEAPLVYDAEAAEEEESAAHDTVGAAEKEPAEAEQDDPEERLAADAKVLGTTADKLGDLDTSSS